MKKIIGVVFLVFVIIISFSLIEANDPNKKSNLLGSENVSTSEDEVEEKVIVTITGEVIKPGEYETTLGFFLQDVISQAGGLTSKADKTCFDSYLILTTDMDIYIPPISEEIKISINNATLQDLTSLTGIGNILGTRILEYKKQIGKFSYLEQIMDVEGIGKSIFYKIKDKICL